MELDNWSVFHVGLGEPPHTLVPRWMPRPLPPRNQCKGWSASTVSCGVVCGVFYCVDNKKALINEDDHEEREQRKLVVETRPGHFWNGFFP